MVLEAGGDLVAGQGHRRVGDPGVLLARHRHHPEGGPLVVELGQNQRVVGQNRLHRLGDPLEDLAHVEGLGEGAEEHLQPLEPFAAPALRVPDPPVVDRRAEQGGDRAEDLLVLGAEGPLAVGGEPDAAGEGLGGPEGLPERRAHAAGEDLPVAREVRVELGLRVVDPRHRTGLGAHPRRPVGQRHRPRALAGRLLARDGRGVEHRAVAVDDAHHAHVVERDDRADRRGDPLEDVLELERLRRGLGDLGERANDGVPVHGTKKSTTRV